MRETVKDSGRIRHMLDAARILAEEAPKHSLDSVRDDRILFFGLAKLIEIIGEAAYKLTKEFKAVHNELPWDAIIGMRHVMVHDYYTMSAGKIWATIESDIPAMIPVLEKYLEQFDSEN